MITIEHKKNCSGCTACYAVCPKHCISMQSDDEGFLYPVVDTKICTDCGLCNKVCPIENPLDLTTKSFLHYVVQNKNEEELTKSTSGGAFLPIARYVIERGGVVFGVVCDGEMKVRHEWEETIEGCLRFSGSKYVQSDVGDSFRQVKQFLEEGRWVCFSGTPCQVAGLKAFLRKDYERLVLVDLVCHGVPSPLFFEKYVDYHSVRLGSKAVAYKSRDKESGLGYQASVIRFEDSTKKYALGMEGDVLMRCFFSDYCSRPSCYECAFKTLNRVSDFTLFDCWGAKEENEKLKKGAATNVFVHTQKGEAIFSVIQNQFEWAESDLNRVIDRDGIMILNSVKYPPKRETFFVDLQHFSISEMEKKYLDTSFVRTLRILLKNYFYRFGLFEWYLKIKKWIGKK